MAAILVADDDRTCRESIQKVLERGGHVVRAVADVDSALQAIGDSAFDLIVCDYKMPGKTGLDLLAELRKRECTAPVLMISAFADNDTESAAIELGALDLLIKPFRRQELIDKATKAVGG
jgi:two-component system, OmpR family, response regulator CpxR